MRRYSSTRPRIEGGLESSSYLALKFGYCVLTLAFPLPSRLGSAAPVLLHTAVVVLNLWLGRRAPVLLPGVLKHVRTLREARPARVSCLVFGGGWSSASSHEQFAGGICAHASTKNISCVLRSIHRHRSLLLLCVDTGRFASHKSQPGRPGRIHCNTTARTVQGSLHS